MIAKTDYKFLES